MEVPGESVVPIILLPHLPEDGREHETSNLCHVSTSTDVQWVKSFGQTENLLDILKHGKGVFLKPQYFFPYLWHIRMVVPYLIYVSTVVRHQQNS